MRRIMLLDITEVMLFLFIKCTEKGLTSSPSFDIISPMGKFTP